MADIRLISILPPQIPVKGAVVPQGTSGSNASPSLANIENGTTLSGYIINRDASGNPVLRTESGDVTFASNFFLKIGSVVVIRVDTGPNQSLAKILSVDGQPPEIAETTSSFAKQPEFLVTSQYRPPSALVSLNASIPTSLPTEAENTTAITVFGTLIKPQTAPTTGPTPSAPALPTGTQLTLRLTSLQSPPGVVPLTTPTDADAPIPVTTASYAAYARAAGTLTATPATQATTESPELPTTPPSTPSATTPTIAQTSLIAPPATLATLVNTTTQPPQPSSPQQPITVPTVTQSPTQLPTSVPFPSVDRPLAPPALTITPIPTTTITPQTIPAPTIIIPGTPSATVQAPQIQEQPAPLLGQTITSQVLGHEPTGEALIQTPIGVVRLQPDTVLPTGSTLTFQILQTTPPTLSSLTFNIAQNTPVSTRPAPLIELAQQWSSLQQIFSLLSGRIGLPGAIPQTSIPTVATSENATPSAKEIGPALLFFLSALRGGNFKTWLGKDNVKFLQDQGQDSILKKAEGEFNSLATQYAEAKPGHWQSLFFPVAVEGMLQQARLFVKRDRKQSSPDQPEPKDENTRFVIEVDLTQLGELQMDGFVRKQEQKISFDLVIRSLIPLSTEVQQDILAIYTATGALTGYKGSLAFQSVKDFPVNPMEDIVAHMKDMSV